MVLLPLLGEVSNDLIAAADEEKKCPTCHGEGEVYAEAPWCRWLPCGHCGGTGSAGVNGDPSRVWGVDDPR